MKTWLVVAIFVLSGVGVASAEEYPKYYERVDRNSYSAIILVDSTHAVYLARSTRPDGTTWFYYDQSATWGPYARDKADKPSVWIKTKEYRFDYILKGNTLVEYDKMGNQGTYNRVVNDAGLGGKFVK